LATNSSLFVENKRRGAFKHVLAATVLFLAVFVFPIYAAIAEEAGWEKKRILIISRMTDHQIDAFYSLLAKENPAIDGSYRPTDLDETNVVIYLLNSWEELSNAPGAKQLHEVFAVVDQVKSPAVSHWFYANYDDGSRIQFFFYSAVDADYPALRCYALNAAIRIGRYPEEKIEENSLSDCSK